MDDLYHYAYLLRIWRAGNGAIPCWRFALEDIKSGQRYGFTNLDELAAFLEASIGDRRMNDKRRSESPDAQR